TLLVLAWGLFKPGNANDAVAVLRQAQKHSPTDFWVNNILGLFLLHAVPVQPEEAVGCFQAARALRPNSYANLVDLGDALLRAGHDDEAIALSQEVVRSKKDFFIAYLRLGDAYFQKGLVEQGEKAYREGVRGRPDSAWLLNRLAWALESRSQVDEAIAL